MKKFSPILTAISLLISHTTYAKPPHPNGGNIGAKVDVPQLEKIDRAAQVTSFQGKRDGSLGFINDTVKEDEILQKQTK